MKSEIGLRKVLEVLDARVEKYQQMLSHEQRNKEKLRAKQLSIVEDQQNIMASLTELSVSDPSGFKYREMHLRKLTTDQRNLQPSLAQAAMNRQEIYKLLQDAMRQRLGVKLQLEKASTLSSFESDETRLQVLFEITKRP